MRLVLFAVIAALGLIGSPARAQTSTTFTYQGVLEDAGVPANGPHDFSVSVWNAAGGGSQVGTGFSLFNVPVEEGRFTLNLPFSASQMQGGERWLQIVVEGVTLSPRQQVRPAPYALRMRGMFANDAGTFVGVGRQDQVSSFEAFGVETNATGSNYGGMYMNTPSTVARPFYGYATGGVAEAWHYLDGSTGTWHVYNGGDRLSVRSDGNVGIGTTNPTNKLAVVTGTGTAIYGLSPDLGVWGATSGTLSSDYGVFGQHPTGSSWGVYASGRLGASGTKSFRIDHPLDPANAYLMHYCSESPEPMNEYSGTVTLDANGEAWVQLPDYFGSINRDLRYQLTCIGGHADVYIADEVTNNRFRIAGGHAGLKVSWEVKGVRNDAWVRAYGAPAEADKPAELRGKYQHPELYGLGQKYAERPLPGNANE